MPGSTSEGVDKLRAAVDGGPSRRALLPVVIITGVTLFSLGLPYTTSSGEGDGTPLQWSCLENPTDGGAW